MTEQIREIPVVRQIQEAMNLCYEAGREPVALIMNQETLYKIEQELRCGFMPPLSDKKSIKLLFGSPVLLAKVKDFYLVDNRSWVEQKF